MEIKEKFRRWLDGEKDVMEHILDASEEPDPSRETIKEQMKQQIAGSDMYARVRMQAQQKSIYFLYNAVAVICCIALIGVLLFTVSGLPRYGEENARATEVTQRYLEHGLEETGAVNVVSGMILDYRAFDTLGESHVLFTALICVMILLGKEQRTTTKEFDEYYQVGKDTYFDISKDTLIRHVALVILGGIFLFGIYVILNGQNSPGGGFSGGAVMGGAMVVFAVSFGFGRTDRFFGRRLLMCVTFVSLAFYIFAKGFVFFIGANGIENPIPKGIPGAILSGGLILPLDIAVGMVVACTMYGFYSLFRRGSIGGD